MPAVALRWLDFYCLRIGRRARTPPAEPRSTYADLLPLKRSFLAELKRRHVYRVGVGYAAFAFVVLQGADLLLPALGVSERSFRLLVILLLVGFPVALVLAWLFDVTPEGLKRTAAGRAGDALSGPDAAGARTPWLAVWTVALMGSVALMAGAGWWYLRTAPLEPEGIAAPATASSAAFDPRSVAVMPFRDLSGDQQDEYFADGITDAVITALTRVQGLRVASRTSSFALKQTTLTLPEIGQELGVASVIEGSIRKSETSVRVDVQLADALQGFEIWTQRYDRPLTDVFSVQDDIAQAIVRVLEVTLAERPAPLVEAPTDDAMAYDKYLWGEYNRNKRSPVGFADATENFEEAIELDPRFANAYAGLAHTYLLMAREPRADRNRFLARADSLAREALRLDPGLASAHAAHAAVLFEHRYAWDQAETELRKAVDLEPSTAEHRQMLGILLAVRGEGDEALEELGEAVRLNPLAPGPWADRGEVLESVGELEQAEAAYRRALELDPDYDQASRSLGFLMVRQGRQQEARELFEGVMARRDAGSGLRQSIAPPQGPPPTFEAEASDPAGLLAALRQRASAGDTLPAALVAPLLVMAGAVDDAVALLVTSYERRTLSPISLLRLYAEPAFRDSPTAQSFLEEIGLRPEGAPTPE